MSILNELTGRNDNLTEVSEYTPTAAETRLLEVMINPEFVGKSVVDKCKAAECTTPVYYTALKKPGFMALVRESAVDLVKDKLIDVIAATVKYAVTSQQNYQDRRILLEMSGMYREKQDISLSSENPIQAQLMQLTDGQVWEKIQEFVKEHPEVIEKMKQNDV